MAIRRPRPQVAAGLLAIAALSQAAAPRVARAAVGAQVAPGYTSSSTTTRDETGLETRSDAEQWSQRYRLTLDNQLYPLLVLSAGGDLRWDIGSSTASEAPRVETDSRIWNTYARLSAGDRILGGGLDYGRRWDEGETRQGALVAEIPGFVRESISAAVSWRPADLPALSLRLSRADTYDDARERIDLTGDEALLTATYEPVPNLDLRYALRYSHSTNHLTDVVGNELVNSGAATWSGRYLAGRGNVYLGYNITARTSDVQAPDGGLVEVRQLPVAGLSIVEQFPATPLRVTLNPNAALIDGNVAASAGVNLGTAAGAGTIIADCSSSPGCRDLGAQFQDVITPVNAIHVYIDQDQRLPQSVAALFSWEAYQSDDNARGEWTPVAVTGPVVYNEALFRFEVPIERTRARYLKVVTRPLRESPATTDPQFREIFVTELQFFDVVTAEEARGRRSDVNGNLSGTTRILLVPDLGLSYDFSGSLAHYGERRPTWSIVNGLSLARRLDPVYGVAARVERVDADAGRGWEALNRWSASLSADPLPTLGALLSYSGQLAQLEGGTALSNSGTFSARADLYEGIALGGTASAARGRGETGVTSRSLLTSVNMSIVPNPILSLAGSYALSDTAQSGGGQPDHSERRNLLEGSASLSPFPALSLAGTVTRQFARAARPVTLWSFSGAFSPFPKGDLQLRYSWTETYDTAAELRTRTHGPGARWNIRPGWYLNAGYSVRETRAPAVSEDSRSFNANLLITLR
jgi:hypothetical protein